MKIQTKAVHAGDRKRTGAESGQGWVPCTTPIHTATSFFYNDIDDLDRVFGKEMPGQSYARYSNPTNDALEELCVGLEGGAGALACSSGMAALHMAVNTALLDRRRVVVAAKLLYGATLNMLIKAFEPAGVETHFVDFDDESAVAAAIAEHRPGAIVMETIANPLLRVPALDRIAQMAKEANAPLIVDNTFATPLILRPFEHGASIVVHSLTKYLSGHGDVLGGIVIANEEHAGPLRDISRMLGLTLGPFEAYLAMRGIKTFPLRMERQCANAQTVASWLATHPCVDRVYFPGDPAHPDAANIQRLFAPGLYGAMVSFEVKDAAREQIFRIMNALKMVVPATSLGDVHSIILYPAMSSHRDLAPKHRARLGIKDNLLRLSVGIEAPEDVMADLDQALRSA
ncbi:MAG TPA: PLP-dependent aspartate aminotransferase family protein [Bryobacteraceae bacterium]|nr:PLP-dependent aspartate aminotransferase family protein [Bryobacteraceae bacterium]